MIESIVCTDNQVFIPGSERRALVSSMFASIGTRLLLSFEIQPVVYAKGREGMPDRREVVDMDGEKA